MDDENYIVKRNYFNKTYKLNLVIQEVRQENELYREKLEAIEKKYNEETKSFNGLEKELKNNTNTENN